MVDEDRDKDTELEDLFHVLKDWEQIQLPIPPQVQAQPQSHRDIDDDDELSVFPPSNHEGLHIPSQAQNLSEEEEDGPPAVPQPLDLDEVGPLRRLPLPSDSSLRITGDVVMKQLNLGFGLVCSKVLRVVSLVRSYCARRRDTSSFGSAVGVGAVLGVTWWYLRWQRQRQRRRQRWRLQRRQENMDRVIRLLQNQDEKINLLLDHIAQLNELLSVRHRVPILRSV